MQCFVVGPEGDESRIAFSALTQATGHAPMRAGDLTALRLDPRFIKAPRSLVLIPFAGASEAVTSSAIDFALEHAGRAFLVCCADTIAPSDYKRLVRTGAAEWTPWRDLSGELRDLIARLGLPDAHRSVKMVSFLPSKGGVGNTTLVIETALHLSLLKRRGIRVAVLDLNLQGGTIPDALDVEPRFDVSEFVDRPERLDEHLVDFFTSQHSKSLDVFASPPKRFALDSIQPDAIFTFVDAISGRYDVLLFDLPPVWLAWTDALLRGSDVVVVSGGESLPALRRLVGALAHVDELGLGGDAVAAVINPVGADIFGRIGRRPVIERTLGGRHHFLIRRDERSAAEALNVGQPLLEVAPNTRIGRDIRRMAEWVASATIKSLPERAGGSHGATR